MNTIDLENNHAIVTGGASGIGYAITRRLLESGASCCVWDINPDRLQDSVKQLGAHGTVHGVVVDVTRHESVQAALDATCGHFDSIEILVNDAGIAGATKKTWELAPDEWRKVLDVNLIGVFNCCHVVVPKMLEKAYGKIVNIASIAGKEGNPNASHYSASKAGVIALTKSLGKELATSGVTVNCITPAVIQTAILEQVTQQHIDYMLSKIPMGRFGKVEEAAAMVAWLSSDDCSFSTAAVFDLSGGRATY
jgi:3-oxoacyl-[acyl-carrier protein] reductase